ncbi:MAG TPA: YicC/YloC family endoribonuclease [Terriglobia bacterium]|nr:YicC/YloC family endoribonuclease [Terriglobia bacterium]
MTGYSNSRMEAGRFSVSVSLKSVNHRFLDLQARLSSGLEAFEPQIRRLVKDHVQRGHVELTVNLEHANGTALKLDRGLLDAYLKTCETIRREFGFSSEPDLVALLRIPGVITGGTDLTEVERDDVETVVEKTLAEGLRRLNGMRESEGQALARDLESRLDQLAKLGARVRELSGSLAPVFRERLERRLRELTRDQNLDPARLAQEVAALAVRSDITEEVMRFQSHVEQTALLLRDGKEIGKKLDFLLQEMNREANTILSKTTDVPEVGAGIGNCALEMKVEIEKLREQAQNIE